MKNEYTITKKEMMSWAKEFCLPTTGNIILFIFWCIVGIIGLGLLTLHICIGASLINWYLTCLILASAIYKLFIQRFLIMSRRYKVLSQTYGVSEWQRVTEFSDDEITVTDHNSVVKFKYTNIQKIIEKNNIIMIVLNHNSAIRLYKNTFTEGSWDQCKEKINSLKQ